MVVGRRRAIRRCSCSSCRTWRTSSSETSSVTSGTDGVYPKGFPIGTVEKSERGHGLYRQITVRPAVDFSSLEDVLIVLVPARPAAARPEPARRRRAREMKIAGGHRGARRRARAADDAGRACGSAARPPSTWCWSSWSTPALAFGPAGGLVAGTVGGLIQDALAGGIIGIGGFSKTLVGFLVGVLGAQFIVSQPLPRFVMFVGATFLHEACFQALYAVVEARPFRLVYSAVLTQARRQRLDRRAGVPVVERGPEMLQRRRARQSAKHFGQAGSSRGRVRRLVRLERRQLRQVELP